MSELTEQARVALANATVGTDVYLIRAITLLLDELEAHQHTYYGPTGMASQAYTTQPQRDIVNPAQKHFEEQQAAKLADKKAKDAVYTPRNEISDRFEPR
jgi:hypothetical protein